MANKVLVDIGFNVNGSNVNGVVGGVGKITGSVNGLDAALGSVTKTLKSLKNTTSLMLAVQGTKSIFGGISSIVTSVKNSLKSELDFVSGFASAGDKIAKTSRLVGFSVKDYQAFSSAAKHSGMSIEEMDSALKKFNVELGKARSGDNSSLRMFDAILGGKKISDFGNSTEVLKAIANGYERLSSAEQKAFVTQNLFGRGGTRMSELLSGGGKGIEKAVADFEKNGGGFTDEGTKNAEKFNDSLQEMSETINSLKISVAEELFPTFSQMFKSVGEYIRSHRAELIPAIREIFTGVARFAVNLLPKIPKILDKVLSFVEMIGPKTVVIGAAFIHVLPAISSIVVGIASILPLIKGIVAFVGGSTLATVGLVVAAVVSWGIAIKSVYDNWDMLKSFIVDDVWGAIKNFGNDIISLGERVWDGFKSVFITPFFKFFDSLSESVSEIWNSMKSVLGDLGSMIYDSIFGSISKAFDAAKSFLKGIPGIGKLFGDDSISVSSGNNSGMTTLGASAAQAVQESRTTVTNRFAVDFKNMPRGVVVTPPEHGDFDYSRGYVLGGI